MALLRVLIVGESGDGKSTLLNNLLGLTGAHAATTGRSSGGVTKQITEYRTDKQINDKVVVLLDSPGVGDMDVTAVQLVSLIEENLSSQHQRPEDALDGLIVTTPCTDARIKLGAQVVQTLVEKGFVGPDKWKNVILNGTKMDRADPDDITFFQEEIFTAFFGADVCQKDLAGQCTLTSLRDTSQIWKALENLPASKVIYEKPDAEDMSKALAAKLGVDLGIFTEKLNQERLKAEEFMKEAQKAKEFAQKAAAEASTALKKQNELQAQMEEDKKNFNVQMDVMKKSNAEAHKIQDDKIMKAVEAAEALVKEQHRKEKVELKNKVAELENKVEQQMVRCRLCADSVKATDLEQHIKQHEDVWCQHCGEFTRAGWFLDEDNDNCTYCGTCDKFMLYHGGIGRIP